MPALNFQQRFAALVESGLKTQTIRRVRKSPIKRGDTIHLYTGLRTKACRKLGEAKCTMVQKCRITLQGIELGNDLDGGEFFSPMKGFQEYLAKEDGFDSVTELVTWFGQMYGLPFEGVIISWDKINQDE